MMSSFRTSLRSRSACGGSPSASVGGLIHFDQIGQGRSINHGAPQSRSQGVHDTGLISTGISSTGFARRQRCRLDLKENRPLSRAEYVTNQSSLYHFLPDASSLVGRMIAAAEKQVLIAEPICNGVERQIHPLAFLLRKLTNPGTGDQPTRRNEARLDALILQAHLGFDRLGGLIGHSLGGGKAKPAGAAE